MYATKSEPKKMVTTTKRTSKPKLSEVRIEPADNGYTVHSRNHGDYMEPAGPPKPKVFEKKNGHEVLKHVARKLGIKAKISPMDEKESAAEDMAEGNQEE